MAWIVPTLGAILWGVVTRTPTMSPGEPARLADVATRPVIIVRPILPIEAPAPKPPEVIAIGEEPLP